MTNRVPVNWIQVDWNTLSELRRLYASILLYDAFILTFWAAIRILGIYSGILWPNLSPDSERTKIAFKWQKWLNESLTQPKRYKSVWFNWLLNVSSVFILFFFTTGVLKALGSFIYSRQSGSFANVCPFEPVNSNTKIATLLKGPERSEPIPTKTNPTLCLRIFGSCNRWVSYNVLYIKCNYRLFILVKSTSIVLWEKVKSVGCVHMFYTTVQLLKSGFVVGALEHFSFINFLHRAWSMTFVVSSFIYDLKI